MGAETREREWRSDQMVSAGVIRPPNMAAHTVVDQGLEKLPEKRQLLTKVAEYFSGARESGAGTRVTSISAA
jgi:hypothetical protein